MKKHHKLKFMSHNTNNKDKYKYCLLENGFSKRDLEIKNFLSYNIVSSVHL